MAKEDFGVGLLQGLYQSGVGNPQVNEERRRNALQEAFLKAQMADEGYSVGGDTVDPSTMNKVLGEVRNILFPGSGSSIQGSFTPRPGGYLDKEGNLSDTPVEGGTTLSYKQKQDYLIKKGTRSDMTAYQELMASLQERKTRLAEEKEEGKQTKEKEKEDLIKKGAVTQADRIINKVDQALGNVSGWTSGWGSLLKNVPGTKAKNLAADILTIKANLGFAELQAMRQASPTGGALGQVAVQELEALQAAVASLDQAQGDKQLRERLTEVKQHYENWKKAVQGIEPEAGGDDGGDNDPLGLDL